MPCESHLRTALWELTRTLRQYGLEDVLVRKRGFMAVDCSKLDCDYYAFLNGDEDAPPYVGEYMSQYSWAEPTQGYLWRIALQPRVNSHGAA